ncbi:MAG: MBL fold metallo-hydrolase [Bacteroidota bacterium]
MKIQYQNEHLIIFESALYRTTTTLFYNEDVLLLVDPNWLPTEIQSIKKTVNQLRGHRRLLVLFTHSDYDHIIAWKAFPEAETIASQAFVEQPQKKKILQQILDFDQMYYIERTYPLQYPDIDWVIERDGQNLHFGQTRLTFYLAPGHNLDGMFTLIDSKGIWIAGDYLSNIEFPFIYHSSLAYEKTLEKVDYILRHHHVQLLVPGHGDHTTDQAEIQNRKEEDLKYIRRLRSAIKRGQPFDEDLLWQRYRFSGGMRGFHNENIKIISGELGEIF